MRKNIIERYLGFYLSKPFWAIKKINIVNNKIPSNFSDLMSQEVFRHDDQKFNLIVSRDGMFSIQIKTIQNMIEKNRELTDYFFQEITFWSDYLKFANAIALLFESICIKKSESNGYFETRELTNKDAFSVRYENNQWNGMSIPNFSGAKEFQMARYTLQNNNIPLLANPLFNRRPTIEKCIFDELSKIISEIIDDESLISLLSEFLKSIHEYKIANFETALVISWFVTEFIIQDKWSDWVSSKECTNPKKKKQLKNKNYPISEKLKDLKLCKRLPENLFSNLDKVREFRNKITHRNKKYKCSHSDARLAITTTQKLIEYHFKLAIEINLNLSIT